MVLFVDETELDLRSLGDNVHKNRHKESIFFSWKP